MLAKWCEHPSNFISMTIFYWQSDNFPLRHWHLTTIATFQHFQLSLHWLTPLNICQHVQCFFFPGWHKHISKQSGKSIRWTVQRHHSGRQQWDKLGRKKDNVRESYVQQSQWWKPASEKFMVALAEELTGKSQMLVQNMWLAMCANQINVCVFTYGHMVRCTYVRYIFIDCVYVCWIAVYVYMCLWLARGDSCHCEASDRWFPTCDVYAEVW